MTIDNAREIRMSDAVDELLDAAVETHADSASGESFTECHICGAWDSHNPKCPVPALQAWQNLAPMSVLK